MAGTYDAIDGIFVSAELGDNGAGAVALVA